MERYVCIHAHFYQPPRENAWLEAVEIQDSAYPYHDWNERVTAECYAPNSASRILDGDGRILQIVNNYSKISFNFGPTLLSWMEQKSPAVYEAILTADRESQRIFSGHGSAVAQAYNHMILPLADAPGQVHADSMGNPGFREPIRPPSGRNVAAGDCGGPANTGSTGGTGHQVHDSFSLPGRTGAGRSAARAWRKVDGGRIDPSMAYAVRVGSGKSINVFFYDGPISRAIAFEDLLADGKRFSDRLLGAFSDARTWPQLVHIATDGETYGHPSRLRRYGAGLRLAPYRVQPTRQADQLRGISGEASADPGGQRIVQNTSWSCVHGIERWRSDCSCNSGGHAGWNQQWRAPLRQAFDWLRDKRRSAIRDRGQKALRESMANPGCLRRRGSRPFTRECSPLHDRAGEARAFACRNRDRAQAA